MVKIVLANKECEKSILCLPWRTPSRRYGHAVFGLVDGGECEWPGRECLVMPHSRGHMERTFENISLAPTVLRDSFIRILRSTKSVQRDNLSLNYFLSVWGNTVQRGMGVLSWSTVDTVEKKKINLFPHILCFGAVPAVEVMTHSL